MGKENINKDFDTELTVSCMNFNTVLKYLKRRYGDISPLFDGFEVTEEYLSDPNNWVSDGAGKRLFYRIKDFTGNRDPKLFFEIGRETENLESLGVLEQIVRLYPNPRIVVERIPHYNKKFNTMLEMEVYDIESKSAKIDIRWRSDFRKYYIYDECPWNFGIIATIPRIWGLPYMEIIEKQCIFNLDEIVNDSYGYLGLKTRFENGRFYVDDEEYAHEVFSEDGNESLGYVATKDLDVGDTHILTEGVIYGAPCCTAELHWENKSIIRNLYDLTLGRVKNWLASREALEKQLDYSRQQFFEIQRLNRELQQYATSLEQKVEQRTQELLEAERTTAIKETELKLEQSFSGGLAHEVRNALFDGSVEIDDLSRLEAPDTSSLDDIIGKLGATIFDLESQGIPHDVIYKTLLPMLQEIDDLSKRLSTVLEKYSKATPTIKNSIGRGLVLAEQFLRYSKMQEIKRGEDEINVYVVARKIGEKYEKAFGDSGIRYTIDSPQGEELIVKGDYVQLEQILENPILNAKDALEGKAGEIGISFSKKEDSVNIIVRDTGKGIPEENIKKVLDPFFSTKGAKGTGLGLKFVKKLVEAYGGSISVKSKMGVGTQVYISLRP